MNVIGDALVFSRTRRDESSQTLSVSGSISGMMPNRQCTHRRKRSSHLAVSSPFRTSGPWLNCCQQSNALTDEEA
jgi:hypothetical protein